MNEDRYVFVIFLPQTPGDLRDARTVTTKSLRLVLGRNYKKAPWFAEYISKARMTGMDDASDYDDSRFQVLLTYDEADRLYEAMSAIGREYGWEDGPPGSMEQAKDTPGW